MTLEAAQAVLSPRPDGQKQQSGPDSGQQSGRNPLLGIFLRGRGRRQVLVYINAETAWRRKSLILLEDETGVLSCKAPLGNQPIIRMR